MAKRRAARMGKSRAKGAAGKKARSAKALRAGTFVIVGIVVDKNTGAPVNNALVKIVGGTINFGKETHTNGFGLYLLKNIFPEKIIIEASKGTKVTSKMKTITGHTILNFAL